MAVGFDVTVRPHPMTVRNAPKVVEAIAGEFGADERFTLEVDIASQESLHHSHRMISDWSGVALEYAFGLERPVLFVDVPRKVNNPDYERIGCEPLEVSIRHEIGEVVSPERLVEIPARVRRLCAAPDAFRERIREQRRRTLFHVGDSGRVGAEAIVAIVDRSATGV